MSSVSVTRKTTIAVKADEISKILRAHFHVPDDAWVEFHFVDYGDTLDRAEISWTVTDEIEHTPPPQPNVRGNLDWIEVAKLAGRNGIRYPSNASLKKFLQGLSGGDEDTSACPVCGNEERGQGGYLSCECPAPPQPNVRGSLASLVRNEVIPALEATGCNVSLAADVRRALAEERERSVYEFDRYVNGRLMAEGVTVEKAKSFEEAMATAARLASRGPNREVPVLVLRTTPPQPRAAVTKEATHD